MSKPSHLVQLYDVVRTAHLERMVERPFRTTMLFHSTRYDFDEGLASRINLRRAGVFGGFAFALRHDIEIIEINEPLVAKAAPRVLAVTAGNRLRSFIRREHRAKVVTYAIENLDPWETAGNLPRRACIRWRLQSPLIPLVWRRVDRIAFGTAQAQALYGRRFARMRHQPESRLFPAVPAALPGSAEVRARPGRIVFLGDLSLRKGFPLVIDAWASIRELLPQATFTILGKGHFVEQARTLDAQDERVKFIENPARSVIFAELCEASVLALPSQRTPLWREQVGLPIVEGLSAGCVIVASTETGLASWLKAHGHYVVDDVTDPLMLVAALESALHDARPASDVLADLPEVDGREAAANWLHGTEEAWR